VSSPPQAPPATEPSAASQAAQAGLAILVAAAIAKLFPSLDLLHLRTSLPLFKAAVAHEVQRHARASATLAARQYRADRVRAGVGGGFRPVPADPPPVAQIAQAVDWAVQPLWNSAVLDAHAPDAPAEVQQAASTAIADAKARLAASSERLVLNAGQTTIIDNAQRDRKARGWARIPEPGACSFCLMLAARVTAKRGAFYTSEQAAGPNQRSARHKTRASEAFVGEGQAKVHDHCRCHIEAVFGPYEPTAQVREAAALWESSTRGKSGNAARIAFRQAVEGRTAPTQ